MADIEECERMAETLAGVRQNFLQQLGKSATEAEIFKSIDHLLDVERLSYQMALDYWLESDEPHPKHFLPRCGYEYSTELLEMHMYWRNATCTPQWLEGGNSPVG